MTELIQSGIAVCFVLLVFSIIGSVVLKLIKSGGQS